MTRIQEACRASALIALPQNYLIPLALLGGHGIERFQKHGSESTSRIVCLDARSWPFPAPYFEPIGVLS